MGESKRTCFAYSSTTRRAPIGAALAITGIDLAPQMVAAAQIHAQTLLENNEATPKTTIEVVESDVLQYTLPSQERRYDEIVVNACFGNFWNPAAVLQDLSQRSLDGSALVAHQHGPMEVVAGTTQSPREDILALYHARPLISRGTLLLCSTAKKLVTTSNCFYKHLTDFCADCSWISKIMNKPRKSLFHGGPSVVGVDFRKSPLSHPKKCSTCHNLTTLK